MLQRGGLIIILAYVLVNIPQIQHLIEERQRWRVKIQLILIFSLFAVISNFTVFTHFHQIGATFRINIK